MQVNRRALSWLVLASMAQARWAQAQGWQPSKPVRLVVGFAPGGLADSIARAVAPEMQARLGQPVIVENRGGAGGSLATAAVAQNVPDGHTLLVAGGEVALFVPGRQGLMAVASLATVPVVAVTRAGTNREELTRKRSITTFAGGVFPYLLARRLGLNNMTFVDFQGLAPALAELRSGQLDLAIVPFAAVQQDLFAGRLHGLAVAGRGDFTELANTPNLSDLPAPLASPFVGLFAPRAMPKNVVDTLNAAVVSALNSPQVKERFRALGVSPNAMSTEAFAQRFLQLVALIPDKCTVKATCDADAQCPRPCPAS